MNLLIRTQQRLLPRFIDIALTMAAWGGMAYLIGQGISNIQAETQGRSVRWLGIELLQPIDTLLNYLVVGLLIGAVLLGWAKYNEKRAGRYQRRSRIPDICERGLAAAFQVSLAVLDCLQNQRVLILHNHEDGSLAAIEFPGTALRLPAWIGDEVSGALDDELQVSEALQVF